MTYTEFTTVLSARSETLAPVDGRYTKQVVIVISGDRFEVEALALAALGGLNSLYRTLQADRAQARRPLPFDERLVEPAVAHAYCNPDPEGGI